MQSTRRKEKRVRAVVRVQLTGGIFVHKYSISRYFRDSGQCSRGLSRRYVPQEKSRRKWGVQREIKGPSNNGHSQY